jgi:hypothetical protein
MLNMKLLRAAVLALVGWYLMVPPVKSVELLGGTLSTQWKNSRSYAATAEHLVH